MKSYLFRLLRAAFGLFCCAFGIHLTVQANIGLAPWDAFAMGLSYHLPISYGTAMMWISLLILIADVLLREHIGIGTLLDAVLVGQALNLFEALNFVPRQTHPLAGAAMMIAGMFILAYFQFVYMSAGLCCGPRDALLVGLGRRFPKVPIGAVNAVQLGCVLAAGALLGGPIGFGTLLSVVGMGASMQLVFRWLHFDPRSVRHEGFAELLLHHHAKA